MTNHELAPEGNRTAWLERMVALIHEDTSPIAIIGTREHGINLIVAELGTLGHRVAWAHFDRFDVGDPESQGSKFAEGVARAVGAEVVGHGLPVDYTMRVIARVYQTLQPIVFALSDVQYAREAAAGVRHLAAVGARVLVFGASKHAVEASEPRKSVGTDELLIREEELLASCPSLSLTHDTLREIALRTRRCFLPFIVECSALAGLPPIIVPEPGGATIEGATQAVVDRGQLVEVLLRRGSAAEALELAIRSKLWLSDSLIAQGAESLTSRGMHRRLFALLESLGQARRCDSAEIMKWYFSSATAIGRHREVKSEVVHYLASHRAPELQALLAAALPGPDLVEQSRAALEAIETPLTLRIHAFALSQLSSGDCGVDLLSRAMRQAEALGHQGQVMACATDLADYWIKRGGYREALEWSRWALAYHKQHGLRDELRRLLAVGLGAFARMLTGDVAGLGSVIDGLSVVPSGVPTTEALISTQADWHFLRGELRRAADLYEVNLGTASFGQFHHAAVDLVHVLVSLGEYDEARSIALRARILSRGAGAVAQAVADLAYGIAVTREQPDEALSALVAAQDGLLTGMEAHKLAQASIAIAALFLQRGNAVEALDALERGKRGIEELGPTGWTLLGGFRPEVEAARRLYCQESSALELVFLGGHTVLIRSVRTELSTRHCELLAVLAMNPQGLSAEELGEKIYGARLNISSLKAAVSRLRKRIPIASKPYVLELPVHADFLQLERYISSNRVRDALALYRGPLLPHSQAPEIVELRDHLEELLRSAVLRGGDTDMVWQLARMLGDDLELVETVIKGLAVDDPRLPIATAMRTRIAKAWSRPD